MIIVREIITSSSQVINGDCLNALRVIPDVDTDSIESVQTRVLIDKYNTLYQADDYKISKLLDRVSLMTPENIHLNTFMYEPLIDMSVRHLIVLYTDVKNALDALP